MAFELEDFTPAKLCSINARSEKHGPDELHPAVDLSFQLDAANTILSYLDGMLLTSLYHKSEAGGQGGQQQLEGVDEAVNLPNLRFPFMGTIKWSKEYAGYTLTIEHGLGGASDIHLVDCKVNEFRINPKEGGTVEIKFRVQCSTNLTEKTMGKLALLVQHEVPIMLEAPEASQDQRDIENPLPFATQEGEGAVENPFPSAQQTPEQAFASAVLQ
ncbi:MAG: hypothetical protein ITG01_13390 [Comamonas sp.]|nr:hypothetical protein [Comamonas sp.]